MPRRLPLGSLVALLWCLVAPARAAEIARLPAVERERLVTLLETTRADAASPASADAAAALAWHGLGPQAVGTAESPATPPVEHDPAGPLAEVAALGDTGTLADADRLRPLLDDADPRLRVAAAHALLRIDRRAPHPIQAIDWLVIACYAVGMLLVGWYSARRVKTADDYMLGNRSMRPWAVGLSLFATLLSTISYLSMPGEIIRHGPMFLSSLAAYPFVIWVVGWFLIPHFMRLPVTSAYEILERRLGLGVRMLGSVLFLSLRLLWMAVIIHATTRHVLVPLLGLDESATPWVSLALGIIPVIYTSMGGLRAVVITDVIQTAILFGGAILSMAFITAEFGGVSGWWPTAWDPHWQRPSLGHDPTARMSFLGAALATFTWFVCTAGSDQMAIQRYLATRDAAAARRMFTISMLTGGTVQLFLAALGFALLAHFRAHPEMLGDGQSIATHADRLFPRFIAFALPPGITGLVIAGLLAAAMSSLSSGLNSSCSVITTDFIERFRRRGPVADPVALARWISVLVGAVVVPISAAVGLIEGNLLEVAYKVVNLLSAPLFGLFFMALFVRRATAFGTFVGAAVGLAVVVAINYWKELTGTTGISFLWGMPLSLVVQVAVGTLASLAPIGPGPVDA